MLEQLVTSNLIEQGGGIGGGGKGGMGEDGGQDGETSSRVGGGGMHGILCLIRLIALHGDTFASSSSPPAEEKSRG